MMIDYIAALVVIGSLFAVCVWLLTEFCDHSQRLDDEQVDNAAVEQLAQSVRSETLDMTDVMAAEYRHENAQKYA